MKTFFVSFLSALLSMSFLLIALFLKKYVSPDKNSKKKYEDILFENKNSNENIKEIKKKINIQEQNIKETLQKIRDIVSTIEKPDKIKNRTERITKKWSG